jgi:Ca-activated chloride channel family protein
MSFLFLSRNSILDRNRALMPLSRRFLPTLCLMIFSVPFVTPTAKSQEPPPPQSQPIRVSVDRVNVGVIVTDSQGRFVGGLRRQDFHVFDNGVEQPLTDFAAIEEPAQLLLLVEAGPAVYLLQGGHLRAVYALLNGLSEGDRVAIARYDQAPQAILNFTADKRTASAALDQLSFNLGFGQLNLSSSIAVVLDWLAQLPGKKTLILLSTGVDTSAPSVSQALLARLQVSDVRILAVSLTGDLSNPQASGKKSSKKDKAVLERLGSATAEFAQAEQNLRVLAGATGGRAYFPGNTKQFGEVYADVAQLVRHEYSLAIAPPAHDGKVHALQIRVDSAPPAAPNSPAFAYHVDHRRAYLAPAPPAP